MIFMEIYNKLEKKRIKLEQLNNFLFST